MREGPWFINVRRQAAENLFGGVYVYELDAERRLALVGRAETAAQDAERTLGAVQLRGNAPREEARRDAGEPARADRAPSSTPISSASRSHEPGSLPLADLYSYAEHLKANDLDASVWEIAFWSRIARLAGAVVVCVFAVPFAFGPLRSAGAGARTVLGIMAGVLFILLTQTLENSGQVYDLNPLLVAWGPTLLMAAIAAIAIWRTR